MSLDQALVSSWSMTAASMILICGQLGMTFLELAQTFKKNRDYVVLKNFVVLITALLAWFCFGYAVAFGTHPDAVDVQFAGLTHGWFGDFSGGLDPQATKTDGEPAATPDTYDNAIIFNQRRFFVFFAFLVLASNITTGSIAERVNLSAIVYFVLLQQILIVPVSLCWTYARPPNGTKDSSGGVGFLYNFGFFDRAGVIPILYGGALASLVASTVAGPRYGVFMPTTDQQKISGGGREESKRGITALLQNQKDKALEVDELYLYKIRKLIKRELTQSNVESGIDLPKMIIGTFLLSICFCMMNSLSLNSQFDLSTQYSRYNANFGFINPLLSGSVSGLASYAVKKYLMNTHVGNHLFDIRALCNGFLAGVVGVSVGSGAMQPALAVLAGLVSGACYLGGCYLFRNFQIDDPIESCQIYILPVIWGAINSVLFMDSNGILVKNQEHGNIDRLGTQLLGLALITILVLCLSWACFFPLKRCNMLRVPRSTEVLGRDTIMNAVSKGLDLDQVVEKIDDLYPEPKKRGC